MFHIKFMFAFLLKNVEMQNLVFRNLRTAFRPRSEGIYMVDPLKDRSNAKHGKAVKVMSVDGLKRVLRSVF